MVNTAFFKNVGKLFLIIIRKENIAATIIPSALLILIVQYYDNAPDPLLWMLGIYFFTVLLLISRLNYLRNKTQWKKDKVFVASDEKIDISIITSVALAIIIISAWSIPSTRAEWASLSQWWEKTSYRFTNTRTKFNNLLSAVDNPEPVRSVIYYGEELALGERTYQGKEEVFIVTPPELETSPPRFYWRVRSYDTYLDDSWSTSATQTALLDAEESIASLESPAQTQGTFTFTNQAGSGEARSLLITAQQPIAVDRTVEALYANTPENALDLNLLRAIPPLLDEESYTVQAHLIAPTVAELRQAGTDYPNWVTELYLQLPEDLPESIRELSQELTAGQATPYDNARNITNYLRTEISYSDAIPTPPRGRDPIEWFLFTWQEGFCNYSATAEVLLLRASGVPSRLVVGFAQGKRNVDGDFVVLQKDAHAWVEMYFPNIGWVEFEPTLNQALLIRPSGVAEEDEFFDMLSLRDLLGEEGGENIPAPAEEIEVELPEEVEIETQESPRKIAFWGMIIAITVIALVGIWYLNREQVFVARGLRFVVRFYERNQITVPAWLRQLLTWSEASQMERAFQSVNFALKMLGEEVPSHWTPQERADSLMHLMPEQEEEISTLLFEHQQALFTPHEGDLKNAQRASKIIRWNAFKRKTGNA